MKRYIFLTANIHPIGGMQNYVAGKAVYLEKNGWKVTVFFWGDNKGTCAMTSMNKYLSGGMTELGMPPGEWPRRIREQVLNRMVRLIGAMDPADEIIVESQDDVLALWGELLAARLQAKHMCFICNETFRGPKKHYDQYLDFFNFKHKRRELTCIHKESMGKLFAGYKGVEDKEAYYFEAANEGPVQNVDNEKIDAIEKADWNICCIGRSDKTCVDPIMDGIAGFALSYPQKKIQLLIVGNVDDRMEWLHQKLDKASNLVLTCLGDLVPIPRTLFSKIDVVIGSSGCAECSVVEGVPTIVSDAENSLANGILGYTVFSAIFKNSQTVQLTYELALKQVLIDKIQDSLPFQWEANKPASYYYDQHMQFTAESEQSRQYDTDVCRQAHVDMGKLIKYYVRKYLPHMMSYYDSAKKKKGGEKEV